MEDNYIVDRIREPSTRRYGFNLLVKAYQERVYWHVRKMVIDHEDANDLTQNIFIKVWNNLERFRAESGLFTWIYRIATNECLSFLKKKRRSYWVTMDTLENDLSHKVDHGAYISGDEIQLKLQKALIKLPDKQRMVFNMKYFDELKFEEIATITGTSVGALKASYHHAVKKIEKILSED
ncbi:RNA polymerase sigma factor [Marinoscillum furvescens]|uniref:RNA polymerase sigma-70 factor (ECF subfamily) n=1 Tax=Marinoscillum furvescens DSM 4134 TaxID=1122208 RepID=A0A3D9L0E5_MARFU|nr:RNA polymerase sigma factor [Marinoscillum furvescens]RED96214.1 RNA polymerase sigma-70 factor (ECF subfamily) [Marinoscillum furvescens DSM 4134]